MNLSFNQKIIGIRCFQTILIFPLALLLSACVNPTYYESAELQRYTIPKYQLPQVGLVIWPHKRKSQRICVDNDYGGF